MQGRARARAGKGGGATIIRTTPHHTSTSAGKELVRQLVQVSWALKVRRTSCPVRGRTGMALGVGIRLRRGQGGEGQSLLRGQEVHLVGSPIPDPALAHALVPAQAALQRLEPVRVLGAGEVGADVRAPRDMQNHPIRPLHKNNATPQPTWSMSQMVGSGCGLAVTEM